MVATSTQAYYGIGLHGVILETIETFRFFSISHLYGEAGGRKNYSAHGCSSILSRSSSPREQLVCPFAVDDESDLKTALKNDVDAKDVDSVVKLRNDPRKSCSLMLKLKCQNVVRNNVKGAVDSSTDVYNQKPVDRDVLQIDHYDKVDVSQIAEVGVVRKNFEVGVVNKPSHFFRISLRYDQD